MRTGIPWVLASCLLATVAAPTHGDTWGGTIGVLGDSYSDEYAFYPPDRSRARNWVEILAALRGLDFGPYSTADRGEPRNQGFAYNWARAAATTESLLAQGQHTGLAEQVARGEVALVCIFIGGNDFIQAMRAPDPLAVLVPVAERAAANVGEALGAILAASPDVKVVLATVPDIRELPEFAVPLSEGTLPRAWADAATDAIRDYNARLRALADGDPRVAVAELDANSRLARLVLPRNLLIAGRLIDRTRCGADLDSMFLADRRHIGTIAHGMTARIFLATINQHTGANIPQLTDREIHDHAASILAASEPTLAIESDRLPPTPSAP